MRKSLYLGERYEREISEFADGNVALCNQLRARMRHAVFTLHYSPQSALNYTFAVTAATYAPENISPAPETVDLYDETFYSSPEHAIVAMAEYSGLGYDAIPAFRAAWRRGVEDPQGPKPYFRALSLAFSLYDSIDSDLLPKVRIPTT